MSSTHLKSLQTINAQTLKKGLDQQSITLIDVREPAEFAREHIPGAILVSLSLFNPRKIPPTNETQLVLYCRSGNRSAVAAQKLFCCWLRASYSPLLWYCLLEGSWIPPTVVNQSASISLQRQVQITAGSLICLGILLGAFVSPWFLLLSGTIGVGLIFSGVTDTCALGMLLAKLPYNHRSQL